MGGSFNWIMEGWVSSVDLESWQIQIQINNILWNGYVKGNVMDMGLK